MVAAVGASEVVVESGERLEAAISISAGEVEVRPTGVVSVLLEVLQVLECYPEIPSPHSHEPKLLYPYHTIPYYTIPYHTIYNNS